MKKIKSIFEGYFLLSLYKLGLITDPEILSMIGNRSLKCKGCPLNDNGWCSSKRAVQVKKGNVFRLVYGCSCFLWAKWFAKDSKCPLNLWEI